MHGHRGWWPAGPVSLGMVGEPGVDGGRCDVLRPLGMVRRLVAGVAGVAGMVGGPGVASYSSNAVPDAATIEALLREVKEDVEVRLIDHTYSFGTHSAALRRAASEYLVVGR